KGGPRGLLKKEAKEGRGVLAARTQAVKGDQRCITASTCDNQRRPSRSPSPGERAPLVFSASEAGALCVPFHRAISNSALCGSLKISRSTTSSASGASRSISL